MDVRSTDQTPGTGLPTPVVPSSPAALFGPMAPAIQEPAMTAASVPPTAPGEPQRRSPRRWPLFCAIGVVALLAGAAVGYFAGAPARNDLMAKRDDARVQVSGLTDQLDTTETDLADSQAALADSQATLAESQDAIASLTTERDDLLAQLAKVENVARARAYIDLNWNASFLGGLQQGGASLAPYDDLLGILGEDMTIMQWAESSSAFRAADAAVYSTRDAELINAWDKWLNTEFGTVEDDAAWNEILLRIDELMLATADAG